MWPRNRFQVLLNFQKVLCKKKSAEVCLLVGTNFDSFANTNLLYVV